MTRQLTNIFVIVRVLVLVKDMAMIRQLTNIFVIIRVLVLVKDMTMMRQLTNIQLTKVFVIPP